MEYALLLAKMKDEDFDWKEIVELEKELNRRITSLETDSDHLASQVHENNGEVAELLENYSYEINLLKKSMEETGINIRNCQIEMDMLISKIQQSAKREEFDNISARIDNLNIPGLLTKYELRQMLK